MKLKNSAVTVIGAARSGIAVAKLLKIQGSIVFVSDTAPAERLQSEISILEAENIAYESGKHSDCVYNCALMVISPGVPSDAPVVLEAQKRRIKVVSELEVGSWFCHAPIVAITGSNGKTTTTTLTGRILSDAEKKHVVAGNIGTAFSSVALALAETDFAILEVSSFQLDHIESFHPKISVLLNITPDHLDRYDHSIDRYVASKARIFENQQSEDVLVYNADDEWTCKVLARAKCRTIGFSVSRVMDEGASIENDILLTKINGVRSEIIPLDKIFIKGMHNVYNAMAATVVAQLIGVNTLSIRSTLESFQGVEHRLEFVRDIDNVRFYNDSKATNVDSVWYAIKAFKEPIVLLLGGRDKGNDYTRLKELVRSHVKAIIAIGESSDKVEKTFREITVVKRAGSMEEAVSTAKSLAAPSEIVLLSPACSSFDWFKNYEHRGQVFKELVQKL